MSSSALAPHGRRHGDARASVRHDGRYPLDGDHLVACQQALRQAPQLQTLQHLLTLVEADLSATARVALCLALHHHHQGLPVSQQTQARAYLDGRFAALLEVMPHWHAPGGVAAVSLMHLMEPARPLWNGHAPATRAGQPAWSPEFVVAWYGAHGVQSAWPLPEGWRVADVWPLLSAQVLCTPGFGLDAARSSELQAACLGLCEAAPEWLSAGLALMFDLAVREGRSIDAAAVLAECCQWGGQGHLRPQALWSWLCPVSVDAGVSPAAWAHLMSASRWTEPSTQALVRAVCAGTVVEPTWAAFEQAWMQASGRGPVPDHVGALPAVFQVWRGVLRAQDALAGWPAPDARQAGQLLPLMQSAWQAGIEGGLLSVRGQGMMQVKLASLHAALGDAPRAFMTWMQARASDEGVAELAVAGQRDWLSQQVPALAQTDLDWVGATDARIELAGWAQLADSGQGADAAIGPDVRTAAQAMLAWHHTEGCWTPAWHGRHPDLPQAERHWHALMASALQGASPTWATLAGQRLQTATFQVCRPLWCTDHGRSHLWRESPGAERLMIVFACVESHHQFASVPSLVAGLPDHHLLFIHNPELNWYSDEAWADVCRLIDARVSGRFQPDQVTCYFGSMGGYGALKVAAHYGFRAVAFNPQIDLDLWAAYRPMQREQILHARDRVNLQDIAPEQWARTPVYLMIGSHTADRAALDLWLQTVQQVRDGDFIVEKFDDPHHAGLIQRASGGQVLRTVLAAEARLGVLRAMDAGDATGWTAIPDGLRAALWGELSSQANFKIELRIRGGRMWVTESLRCGTRAAD